MQNSDNIKAYMDDYGKVVVPVSKRYYQGKSDYFYISDNEDFYHDCVISKVDEHPDYNIYHLSIPCDIEIGKSYTLFDSHGVHAPIIYRFIVKTAQFAKEFYYDGDDLGSRYHRTFTDFALWAPTADGVVVEVRNKGTTSYHTMTRKDKGVYRARVSGDLKFATYVYYVNVNGKVNISCDPYAYSSTANGQRSAVIDFNRVEKSVEDDKCVLIRNNNDAIIYEISVRDMTSLPSSNASSNGLFNSLSEERTSYNGYSTGMSYIKELGVTHVQLMPIYDFATVDENHSKRQYNWGYDPSQYSVPEGSYSSNPNDPYARVNELKHLINTFHRNGIRVNMDVVFNHMYDMTYSSFNKCVPFYYFRYNDSGYLSNGSYCGNDMDSTQAMVRKYILDNISMWMSKYGIDGFRFDLMGIIDIDTMNLVFKRVKELNPSGMVYGEGWNMPTALSDDRKASIMNSSRMPNVACFNDYFRDVVKGKTSDDERYDQGYVTGNLYKIKEMESALVGNCIKYGHDFIYETPNHSVNYVECHDNCTSWDKMKDCCKDGVREERVLRQKLMIATVMFAQGVPFIHSGQEFCRTKLQYSNTYNKPDSINGMDWARRCAFNDVVEFTKDCIAIRRRFDNFKLNTAQEVLDRVIINVIDGSVLEYTIKGEEEIKIIINPSHTQKYVKCAKCYQVLLDEQGKKSEALVSDELVVKAVGLVVAIAKND